MNNYEVAYYVLIEKIGKYISQEEKEKLITSLLDDKQYIDLLKK